MGLPVLGICYGLQYMVHTLGGKVSPAANREYGHAQVEMYNGSQLFDGLPSTLEVWMSHGDEADKLPDGFQLTASLRMQSRPSKTGHRRWWAVQFHPEVHHTPHGAEILRNFTLKIAGAKPNWTAQRFIDVTVESVRKTVGDGRAICALSGGVDSAVAAVLVDRALRDATANPG